jgi:type IV secretion system T-DNA border endonuclease VirD2
MAFESELWEATRPSFLVRYVPDQNGRVAPPVYAFAPKPDIDVARAKLARIARGAPEVVVKVTGRQKGSSHVEAHLTYIGRAGDVEIETRDGEILTSKEDILERAEEWSDTLYWRERSTVSSVSMILSMPEGTDPEAVLGAVRAVAQRELSDNHDYVMALHTDTPRPHVHLTVQAEGLDRNRFNPRPADLHRLRERFAQELRERGVEAEATPRRARGRGVAGSSMALVKMRVRLRGEGSRQMPTSDMRSNDQAVAVARGELELPAFVAKGKERWQDIRSYYAKAADALDATGDADDRKLASDVRGFLQERLDFHSTPEVFAQRHAALILAKEKERDDTATRSLDKSPPERPPPGKGRSR